MADIVIDRSDAQIKAGIEKASDLQSSASEIDGSVNQKKFLETREVDTLELGNIVSSFSSSSNLFNEATISDMKIVGSNGDINDSTSYSTSDYIPVVPDTYSFYGFLHCARYDKDKNFISRDLLTYSGHTYDLDEETAFIRVNWQPNNSNKPRQVNKASSILPYEEYYVKTKDTSLEAINKQIEKRKDTFIFDSEIPTQIYRNTEVIPDRTSFGDSTHIEARSLFNSLVDNAYSKKFLLTSASDGSQIPIYKFRPIMPDSDRDIKKLTICIVCGLHGSEKASTLVTYTMMEQIVNNWENDEILEFLRWNVNFIIIPVANPTGWDDFTRKSRNGVDINRNFIHDWKKSTDTTSSTYPGLAPESEIETQNIVSVINDNDIDMLFDFHNFHLGSNGDYFAYIPTNSDTFVHNLGQKLYSRMTREWKKTYNFIPDDYFIGFLQTASNQGMLQNYAQFKGIKHSCTFEICNRWVLDGGDSSVPYDDNTVRCGTELLVNWLIMNCRHIQQI